MQPCANESSPSASLYLGSNLPQCKAGAYADSAPPIHVALVLHTKCKGNNQWGVLHLQREILRSRQDQACPHLRHAPVTLLFLWTLDDAYPKVLRLGAK